MRLLGTWPLATQLRTPQPRALLARTAATVAHNEFHALLRRLLPILVSISAHHGHLVTLPTTKVTDVHSVQGSNTTSPQAQLEASARKHFLHLSTSGLPSDTLWDHGRPHQHVVPFFLMWSLPKPLSAHRTNFSRTAFNTPLSTSLNILVLEFGPSPPLSPPTLAETRTPQLSPDCLRLPCAGTISHAGAFH